MRNRNAYFREYYRKNLASMRKRIVEMKILYPHVKAGVNKREWMRLYMPHYNKAKRNGTPSDL